MNEISIAILADRPIERAGLCALLARVEPFDVVGEFGDLTRALDFVSRTRPAAAIIDERQPEPGVIESIRRLRAACPETACIVLCDVHGTTVLREAIVAGASGFVAKAAGVPDLIEAVHAVAAGRSYFSPGVSDQLADAFQSTASDPHSATSFLTKRQREVLTLIADGHSTKEIAARLGISEKTAQTHRAKLMGKTGIRKSSSLVRYAIREGFVSA